MNGKVAVGTALGLILGLIAGLFFGGLGQQSLPSSGVDPLPQTETPTPSVVDEPLSDPAPVPLTIADLIEASEIPPVPSGNAVVSGTVTTPAGTPVAGIRVSVSSFYPGERRWKDITVEERVRQELQLAKWMNAATRKTTTDEDGNYRVEGLAESVSYNVTAEGDGWYIEQRDKQSESRKGSRELHFVATSRIPLTVSLRVSDGSQLLDARIWYRAKAVRDRRDSSLWNENSATLYLTPGEYEVYATSTEWPESRIRHRSEPLTVIVEAGTTPDAIELVLHPTPWIGGEIKLAEGFVRSSVEVYVQYEPEDDAPVMSIHSVQSKEEASLWTIEGKTTYRMSNVKLGRYRVMLVSGNLIIDWADVLVEGGETPHDFELPAPTLQTYIAFRVFSPDGELLKDVRVEVNGRAGYKADEIRESALYNEDGTIWVKRISSGFEAEWYEVIVTSTKHGEATARYEASSQTVLDIHLQRPAFLELTVPNWENTPGRGLLRWELEPLDPERRVGNTSWDSETQKSPIRLGPVEPGEYSLQLRQTTEGYDRVTLMEQEVTLSQGDNYLTVAAPELYSLKIIAPDPNDPPYIEIKSNNETFRRDVRSMFRRGVATIVGLPAGTYVLTSGRGEMQVTLPGTTEVTFNPPEYDCVVLRIRPVGGRIEGLGLKDGDKLIEVDGTAIDPRSRDEDVLYSTVTKESTTWVVLRGGIRTDVTFDGRELFKILAERKRGPGEDREDLDIERGYRD